MSYKRLTGSYYIHDNGENPYRVVIFDMGENRSTIEIYKAREVESLFVYDQLFLTYENVKKVFIPDDPGP